MIITIFSELVAVMVLTLVNVTELGSQGSYVFTLFYSADMCTASSGMVYPCFITMYAGCMDFAIYCVITLPYIFTPILVADFMARAKLVTLPYLCCTI